MHFLQGINNYWWVRSDISIIIIVVLLAAAISLQATLPSTQMNDICPDHSNVWVLQRFIIT